MPENRKRLSPSAAVIEMAEFVTSGPGRRGGGVPVDPPKPGTRPMLIFRAVRRVDFVFDILDSEGEAVPTSAFNFPTFGNFSRESFDTILGYVRRSGIELLPLDRGD